jgi:D-serine deaminase-like pyridoxal phosphate-dependent protein
MVSSEDWYCIKEIEDIDSPALVIFRNRVEQNIRQMIKMVSGDTGRLMPHIKTYKIAEVIKMQMASGINSFKCATIAEAELLGMSGTSNALLAYQPSEVKLKRLVQLINAYPETRFSTLIDNKSSAQMIDSFLGKKDLSLDVYIDINNGNNRTGINPDQALDLYDYGLGLKAVNLKGLHIYDGHIRNADLGERKKACERDFAQVTNLADTLEKKYGIVPEIIAGGSPTFPVHASNRRVICSPGTTLFWDAGYGSRFRDMPFLPSAVLVTRVVSSPAQGIFCLDLGHKAVASENSLENRVVFLNVSGLKPIGHSEEHLVVENTKNLELNIGDVIYGLPYHICPTTALYNEVAVVDNQHIVGKWEVIARNRKINY